MIFYECVISDATYSTCLRGALNPPPSQQKIHHASRSIMMINIAKGYFLIQYLLSLQPMFSFDFFVTGGNITCYFVQERKKVFHNFFASFAH